MTEQQPDTRPRWAPDVVQALEGASVGLLDAISPLADLVSQRDDMLAAVLPRLVALQESLTAVMALLDARGVRPNWATEVRTLETARALLASMTIGEPDGTPDPR